jgi:hypothetical protein
MLASQACDMLQPSTRHLRVSKIDLCAMTRPLYDLAQSLSSSGCIVCVALSWHRGATARCENPYPASKAQPRWLPRDLQAALSTTSLAYISAASMLSLCYHRVKLVRRASGWSSGQRQIRVCWRQLDDMQEIHHLPFLCQLGSTTPLILQSAWDQSSPQLASESQPHFVVQYTSVCLDDLLEEGILPSILTSLPCY